MMVWKCDHVLSMADIHHVLHAIVYISKWLTSKSFMWRSYIYEKKSVCMCYMYAVRLKECIVHCACHCLYTPSMYLYPDNLHKFDNLIILKYRWNLLGEKSRKKQETNKWQILFCIFKSINHICETNIF